jgi:hypothetical protein
MVARTGSSFQPQSVFAHCRLKLPDLVPLGPPAGGQTVEHERQLRVYHNVVTAANAGELETEGVGEAEQIVEPNVKIAAFDPRPRPARIHGPT